MSCCAARSTWSCSPTIRWTCRWPCRTASSRRPCSTASQPDSRPCNLRRSAPQPQAPPTDQPPAASPAPPAAAAIPPALLTLLVEGKGRHRLELDIRVAVVRQGGSRLANATIPYAEATAVKVTVPEAETNVRHNVGGTVLSETTTQNQQTIDATLGDGGRFEVTWRAGSRRVRWIRR